MSSKISKTSEILKVYGISSNLLALGSQKSYDLGAGSTLANKEMKISEKVRFAVSKNEWNMSKKIKAAYEVSLKKSFRSNNLVRPIQCDIFNPDIYDASPKSDEV